ncbi:MULTISPECIES: regulator [unclassified Stappia]|uniref:regulator n=1 Tax=unclassified Stappia TaxID=2629676 RepID=UPI001643D1FD|nr:MULTISPECIES: regulator [unclassified Stappia]
MAPHYRDQADAPAVYIILGHARAADMGTPEAAVPVNILLRAADEDSAVRIALEALKGEGFVEATLDQIGVILDEPDDPTFEQAYEDALAGEVAVIAYRG